jgi:hypothetical protein
MNALGGGEVKGRGDDNSGCRAYGQQGKMSVNCWLKFVFFVVSA